MEQGTESVARYAPVSARARSESRRALLVGVGQDRDRRVRPRARRARHRDRLDRRHGPRARRGRDPGPRDHPTSPASPRSWTAGSRRCTRSSTPGCSRSATTPSTCSAAEEHDVEFVDLVCVNLYPFERTAATPRRPDDEVIENIDIGGPTMIRAAAKNYAFAAPVVTPESYDAVLAELREADRTAVAAHAREPGRRGVRLHRPLRHRDRPLVPGEARGLPAADGARLREGAGASVRREPAPARRLLRAGRARGPTCSRWSPSSAASSCRSTTCSTSTPPGC